MPRRTLGAKAIAQRIVRERAKVTRYGGPGLEHLERLEQIVARFGPSAESFPQQRDAARSRAPYEAWQVSRRGGKTTTVMLIFHEDGSTHPDAQYIYLAKTAKSAKHITWGMAKRFARSYGLKWESNVADQTFTQPNGARLVISGADNPQLTDLFHGGRNRGVFLDEVPFWANVDVGAFIEEVLSPTLADENGILRLMSRPGYRKAGYFWDACAGKLPGWGVRKWGWEDNHHVADAVRAYLAQRIESNPDIVETPAYRRNWLNEWVEDSSALAYRFDAERCGVAEWELDPGDRVVLGLDLGWLDASAFSVITWSDRHPYVVELESHAQTEMLLEAVAARCRMYLETYPGIVMVGDPSRRQAFEELRKRYNLPILPAEKTEKRHWMEQINSDYAVGNIKIKSPGTSAHVAEMDRLTVTRAPGGSVRETHGQPNDCCDAFLYAYRYAYHYLYDQEAQDAEAAEIERLRSEEAKLEAAAEAAHDGGVMWL